MELHQFEPEQTGSVPLEEPEAVSGETTPPQKRRRARVLVLLPALAVCAILLAVGLNWSALRVTISPMWALRSGVERVMDLPQCADVGFLGEVTLKDQSVNCSGVLGLQTAQDGLRLLVRDCTLGTDTQATTFSLYLSPQEVAAQVPDLTGGQTGWYGVSLVTPIAQQAAGTGGEASYGWFFQEEQIAALQEAADQTREALKAMATLTPSDEEQEAVEAFLRSCETSVERTREEYLLHFTHPGEQETEALCRVLELPETFLTEDVALCFTLQKRGTLRGVDLQSEGLSLFLELGEDPERELTPRLEAEWGGGQNALTLALTVEEREALEMPAYENAFSLLPRMD